MKPKPVGTGNTTAPVYVPAVVRSGGKGGAGGEHVARGAPALAAQRGGRRPGKHRGCRAGPGCPSPTSPVLHGRPQPGPCPPSPPCGGGPAQPLPPADSPTAERGCGPAGGASSAEQSSARPRAKRPACPPSSSMLAVPGAPCPPTAAHVTVPARRKGASPGWLVQAPAVRCLPGTAGNRHRAPPAPPGAKSHFWPGLPACYRAVTPEGGGGGSCCPFNRPCRGSGWPLGGASPRSALRRQPGRGQG